MSLIFLHFFDLFVNFQSCIYRRSKWSNSLLYFALNMQCVAPSGIQSREWCLLLVQTSSDRICLFVLFCFALWSYFFHASFSLLLPSVITNKLFIHDFMTKV